MRYFLSITLFVLLFCISAAAEVKYPGYYCRPKATPEGTVYDTVAYLEFVKEPALYEPGTLRIKFCARRDDPKGVTLRLLGGQMCKFAWDSKEYVIDRPVSAGDSLEAMFTFTPLEVAEWFVTFGWYGNSQPPSRRPSGEFFVVVPIDEHGKFRNTGYSAAYGPTLQAAKDSLILTESGICDGSEVCNAFLLQMRVKPNFANGAESGFEYLIIPLHDFPEGVSYLLQWNNGITMSLADSSDWNSVLKGDTLKLTGTARVLEPGECKISLRVCGYTGESDSLVPTQAQFGESSSSMRRHFFFDQSLSYTALSGSSIIDLKAEDIADGYRLEELKPLHELDMTNSAILSENYGARTKEIARLRYEQKQVEKTPDTQDSVDTRHDVER